MGSRWHRSGHGDGVLPLLMIVWLMSGGSYLFQTAQSQLESGGTYNTTNTNTNTYYYYSSGNISKLAATSGGLWDSKRQQQPCNIFQGQWVYDKTLPLYNSASCPFIKSFINCQGNGRPDQFYPKFRWQPLGCNIPRFDAQDFLKRFRDKKILFVGDSLGLNQWQSLACLIHSAVPQARYNLLVAKDKGPPTYNFELPEYGIQIMMEWNQLLVDIIKNEGTGRVLKLNSIDRSGEAWKGMDILVFDSWRWWFVKGPRQQWDYIQVGRKVYKDLDRLLAYQIALRTWARWVDRNVDPRRTRVFFQGFSESHFSGREWGRRRAKSCVGQRLPILGHTSPLPKHEGVGILQGISRGMRNPPYFLDVTLLTSLRPDGHPGAYGTTLHSNSNDCTHWCVAGVPDTWNQLLYAALIGK